MQSSRDFYIRNKPRLILDKRFPFARDIEMGGKGQAQAFIEVISTSLESDEGNDMVISEFLIKSIGLADSKEINIVKEKKVTAWSSDTHIVEPIMRIHEKIMPSVGDMKLGDKIGALISFQVIEKTRNFVILKVGWVEPMQTRRKF